MGSFNYDQYAREASGESPWFKFREVGDEVTGEVLEVREGATFNGDPVPELVLGTEDGQAIITASQVMLLEAIIDVAPEIGETIRVAYVGNGEAKPGKAAPKLFEVQVL